MKRYILSNENGLIDGAGYSLEEATNSAERMLKDDESLSKIDIIESVLEYDFASDKVIKNEARKVRELKKMKSDDNFTYEGEVLMDSDDIRKWLISTINIAQSTNSARWTFEDCVYVVSLDSQGEESTTVGVFSGKMRAFACMNLLIMQIKALGKDYCEKHALRIDIMLMNDSTNISSCAAMRNSCRIAQAKMKLVDEIKISDC